VFREYYERLARGYAEDLTAAVKRGEISAGDSEARAWSIMGIGHFVGMRWCLWNGTVPPKKVVDELMSLIAHGIAPVAAAKPKH
jgi:hypothetical protein